MPRVPAVLANRGTIREYAITASEAWEVGAVVLLDGNETLIEASADPTVLLGFSLAEVSAGDLAGEMAGLGLGCPVALAEVGTRFWIDGDNDPVATDRNRKYGMAVDADGIWHIDGTETTTTSLYVHDIDTDINRYLVEVLASRMQVPTAAS